MSIQVFGSELLTGLLTFTVASVPGALGAGLNVAADMTAGDNGCLPWSNGGSSSDGSPRSVAAVGVAAELDPIQWAQASGPLWSAFRSGQMVMLPDPSADPSTDPSSDPSAGADTGAGTGADPGAELDQRPAPDPLAQLISQADPAARKVKGAVFLAGEWGGDLPVIVSIYLDRVPDNRVLAEIDRYEPLVTQALAVVEYCSGEEQVARQMLQMTQYRRVIEQAKGLVMGAAGGNANSAFATLARGSQHFNIRLRNLAVALVEHVGQGSAEHPDDPDLVVRPTEKEREVAARVWAALTTSTAILPLIDASPPTR